MSNTVVVACKLPHGLTIQHAGKSVTLNGSNHKSAVAGYGMTPDVDAEFFEAWKKSMTATADGAETFAPLKQNLIFAAGKLDVVHGRARERESLKTGFEGLDPDKPAKGIEKATV